MGLNPLLQYILLFLVLASCSFIGPRGPSSAMKCQRNGVGCPFLVIAHRGAPFDAAENTIQAFAEAMKQGANALEIDLVMTADQEMAVYHDRNPNDLIALIRQAGLEGQKYIPYVPDIGSKQRVPTEKLTLNELREFYGYALNKGVFKDIFTSNQKDQNALIPTLEDFAVWANSNFELEAVFLDIKLVPGQESLVSVMGEKIHKAFANSPFRVFLLTQYEEIYGAFQTWIRDHSYAEYLSLTLDMEHEGALQKRSKLREKLRRKVKSLALGKTVLRSWDGYSRELQEVLNRARRRQDLIYPVVSWTIDDERKLYQLLQMGVDGILTNRPSRLNRLLNRHWKDHATAAKTLASCYEKARREGPWLLCAGGTQLAPLGPIGQDEIRRWVCAEKGIHSTLRDFYGCGGIFDKVNIHFSTKLEDDPRIVMYTSPKGSVEVTRLPILPTENDQLVFLEFVQDSCNDGALNYRCEYQLEVEQWIDGKWVALTSGGIFKDGFSHAFTVTGQEPRLRLRLSETDDGKIDEDFSMTVHPADGHIYTVRSPRNVFTGKFKFHQKQMASLLRKSDRETKINLEFVKKSCNDGVLNYKCEFKVAVDVMGADGKLVRMQGHDHAMKDSFVVFGTIPSTTVGLKIRIMEMDENSVSAEDEVYLGLEHGSRMTVDSGEGTFTGEIVLKLIDYDETTQGSEADPEFRPHHQKDREDKIFQELRMP